MSRKTIAKAKFLITEAQNKDAEKAITPDIYIVNATNERIRLSMRVTRDGDGARRDEHHTIDPMNREHFTPCKTGEFVYPDEFRVAPENDAPASPPLIDGRYLLEARTCTAVMRTHPDGTIESWNDYKPFARGEIEVSSYRASSR